MFKPRYLDKGWVVIFAKNKSKKKKLSDIEPHGCKKYVPSYLGTATATTKKTVKTI